MRSLTQALIFGQIACSTNQHTLQKLAKQRIPNSLRSLPKLPTSAESRPLVMNPASHTKTKDKTTKTDNVTSCRITGGIVRTNLNKLAIRFHIQHSTHYGRHALFYRALNLHTISRRKHSKVVQTMETSNKICQTPLKKENMPDITSIREWHLLLWSPIPWVNAVLNSSSSSGIFQSVTQNSIWDIPLIAHPASPTSKKQITEN
jgi:hypothetical protein